MRALVFKFVLVLFFFLLIFQFVFLNIVNLFSTGAKTSFLE